MSIINGEDMINKQGLLFLTLTSLILVLSVYYITMPNELLLTTNNSYNNTDVVNNNVTNNELEGSDKVNVNISQSSTIEAMRNILDDERIKTKEELNKKIVNNDLTIEEINNVYEELKYITKIEGLEATLEQKIKENFELNSFVKINDDVIEVVVSSSKHNPSLVVKIINCIEEELDTKMYISVSFKE